jgi:hypothetical protein
MDMLDRRLLTMHPLSQRHNKLRIEEIAVSPDTPASDASSRLKERVGLAAQRIRAAREKGKPVMLTYGAHLVKNGLAPVVIQMMKDGWITHLATNGAGSIHDWEFAFIGESSEDVEGNAARGEFGTWDETGRCLNLAVAVGGTHGLGYGASVGSMIAQDGLDIPSVESLRVSISELSNGSAIRSTSGHSEPSDRACESVDDALGAMADMLSLVRSFDLQPGRMSVEHPFKKYSIQGAAYRLGIPFTVHPGIGYDIIYTHPMNSGGAIGRGAVRDFLGYAHSVSRLGGGGVHIAVGSAVMAPMIFEKSLSMANNLSINQTGKPLADYHLLVVDIQEGGDWDWSDGEPPMDNPAYYLRFCKTFHRMGGHLDYLCLDNRAFLLGLYQSLASSTPGTVVRESE